MWNPFSKNSQSVRNAQKSAAASTQQHVPISEIRDNTVVLKNGGVRAVLKTSSVNFNLKSEDEQNAIILSYQNFLNSLEFPIQIMVRSKKLDLDNYIDDLRKIGEQQTNLLLQKQTFEYIDFISKLIEYADIMQKEFYAIVSVDPARAQKVNFIQAFWQRMNPKDTAGDIVRRHREFEQLQKTLLQRVSIVTGGLEATGMKVQQLNTHELVNLYYQSYNPITSRYEKLQNPEELYVASDAELNRNI